MQRQGNRVERIVVRNDEFRFLSRIVIITDHTRRPAPDGLQQTLKSVAGCIPRYQLLVVSDAQLIAGWVVLCHVKHAGQSAAQVDLGNNTLYAFTGEKPERRLPSIFQGIAISEVIPGVGKNNPPGPLAAAVYFFNIGHQPH